MRFALWALVVGACPLLALAQAAPPTVVFEAGLGDDGDVWRPVIRRLDNALPTYAYDRPGYDGAPRASTGRDPCTIARELHARLEAEGVAGPYIITGHSLGGQYAYAFARLFPEDTAGLLLVDATPTGHWEELQREVPAIASAFNTIRAITFSRTMKAEFAAQDQCLADLGTGPLAAPAIVLARSNPEGMEGERLLRLWHARQQSWLARTGADGVRLVDDTGHYIMRDAPGAVVDALRELAGTQAP